MIPQTLGTLLAFLAFVAPGLAFELLRERRRPFIEETTFREASRVVLTSVLFTVGALVVLAAVRLVDDALVADPARWLRDGQRYVEDRLGLVARTLVMLMAVAFGLTLLVDWLLRRSAPGRIVPGSIWFSLFRTHRPANTTPWVHLRLSDETEIWGYAGDYTPDQSLDNRELVLEGPRLQYKRKNATDPTSLGSWSFISVRGEDITWMKVQYVRDDSAGVPTIVPAVYPKGSARRPTTKA